MHASSSDNNITSSSDRDNIVSTDDIVVEDSFFDEKEAKKPVFKPLYAYFVLGLVLVCRIMVQWHRQSL